MTYGMNKRNRRNNDNDVDDAIKRMKKSHSNNNKLKRGQQQEDEKKKKKQTHFKWTKSLWMRPFNVGETTWIFLSCKFALPTKTMLDISAFRF